MKHLLLVDDVATNLICAVEVLKGDYEISTAKSGRQALLMLEEMAIPDLIILDVNMPNMNGYEVFEKIKENPAWSNIPVVFLTAETNYDNEVKGLQMGALDYIRKPFDPVVFKTRIEKILQQSEGKKALADANIDYLTGFGIKKVFDNYISNAVSAKDGYFLLINLDNFKEINEIFGHSVGDNVLVKVSDVFRDFVKDENRICRISGDIFAIFLPSTYTRDEIKSYVRKLIASCEYEISETLSGYSEFGKVSVSVGISIKPGDGEDLQTLYTNADKALYFVRQNGKRGYHFYDTVRYAPEEFEEENTKINLIQLQRLVNENDEIGGAYTVEYEGFKRIYRFVSRCMERSGEDAQMVLFTINVDNDRELERENRYIITLRDAITSSLRRADVATQCGNCQYVVILLGTGLEGAKKVIDRINNSFNNQMKSNDYQLSYEVETVTNK